MKKYLSKKRVLALLISISMLISAIVMIPIPIEHVSAEDIYFVEEVMGFAEPIVLPVNDDNEENSVMDIADFDMTYDDTSDIDTSDIETTDDDDIYIDTSETETSDIDIPDNDTDNNGDESNDKSSIESMYCESCEQDTCICNTDQNIGQDTESFDDCHICGEIKCFCTIEPTEDCETCDEDCETCDGDCETCDEDYEMCNEESDESVCICEICEDSETCGEDCEICDDDCECIEECEICDEECECDRLDFALTRNVILIASNVNNYDLLNRIINGTITANQADNFEGNFTSESINTAITGGTLVIINISSDINISPVIRVQNNRNILITSQNGEQDPEQKSEQNITYALTVNSNIRHFEILTGGSLTLQNIEIKGYTNPPTGNITVTRGGINVNGGTLIIENGAKIINNSFGDATGGGGVAVLNGGKFEMNGGSISGNLMRSSTNGGNRGGGGVYVAGDINRISTFIMNGGEISKNAMTARSVLAANHMGGGGVYVANYGRFELNGGAIQENETIPHPVLQNGGGGVFVAKQGVMVMSGGLITKNHAANSTPDWQGGGGIFTVGTVTMYDGKIDGNTAAMEGGGVFVGENGFFHMYKGEIINNHAISTRSQHGGGGVMITGGTFITYNRTDVEKPEPKIIRGNSAGNNGGGISLRGAYPGDFRGPGILTIVDGTEISGNSASLTTGTLTNSLGGAIFIAQESTLNLYGGEIFGNNAGNSKGITWVTITATINLRGNPRITGDNYIHRYNQVSPPNQIMIIQAPLGENAQINVRDNANDRPRPNFQNNQLTVIARRSDGLNATDIDAKRFNYLGTMGTVRENWDVVARDPGNNRDLVLEPVPRFALLRVPDNIHFGERPLLTMNFVGPYGDAPQASNVEADFSKGMENWQFGFEIENTEHNNWTVTLQATPFINTNGIIGANPVAVPKIGADTTPLYLNSSPWRVISRNNQRGKSIKWHWTQLDYKIEAQTALDTVVADKFQSVFSWTLLDVPS